MALASCGIFRFCFCYLIDINAREEFIESLAHDSFVIQIPKLHRKRQNDLEILLSVFDQENIAGDNHILNVREEDFPEKYRLVVIRLQRAIAEPKALKTMNIEDEILEELQNKEREIERKDVALKEQAIELKEKDKIIEELKKTIKGEFVINATFGVGYC